MGCSLAYGHCGVLVLAVFVGALMTCLGQNTPSAPPIKGFVIRDGSRLLDQGQPYYITGFNNYYLPTYSVWSTGRTDDVNVVFRDAQKLGLNALRTWAFSDGSKEWNGIQPKLGELNETVLSQGLDYVVAQAALHGIRLILTLTNYWPDYGGTPQWAQWYNQSSLVEFYQDENIRAGVKSYMGKIIMRNNTITGRLYRDEPAILAWDIMNEPQFPGDDTGKLLTAWIDDMASFIKGVDPNHLVMVGSFGAFGASTPGLLAQNPTDMVVLTDQDTRLFPVAQVCQGEDSSAIAALPHIDMADMHIYPEMWSFCTRDCNFNLEGMGPYQIVSNLSSEGFLELCSFDCRVAFMRKWIQSHLQECKRIGKPLIVSEFGMWRPMSVRNEVFQALYEELLSAKNSGLPVAGSLFWMLEAAQHNNSMSDNYAIFANSTMYTHSPHRIQPMPPPQAKAPDPKFYNEQALLQCASARIPVAFNADSDINNDEWQTTLQLISQQAAQLSGSQAGTVSSESLG